MGCDDRGGENNLAARESMNGTPSHRSSLVWTCGYLRGGDRQGTKISGHDPTNGDGRAGYTVTAKMPASSAHGRAARDRKPRADRYRSYLSGHSTLAYSGQWFWPRSYP